MNHEDRLFRFMDAIANPQPYKVVDRGGPVKENIIRRNIDLPRIYLFLNSKARTLANLLQQGG